MTVATTVSPASRPWPCSARASTARIWSPSITSPAASTARQRSASPSCAIPASAPCLGHGRAQGLQVGGATAVVDVLARQARRRSRSPRRRPAAAARARTRRRRRAHSPPPRAARPAAPAHRLPVPWPAGGQRGEQVSEIALPLSPRRSRTRPNPPAGSPPRPGRRMPSRASISSSAASGSLKPPRANSLIPLSGGRVVAGRQHHAEVGAESRGQEGDGRGGDDAEPQHVHAGPGQAGHHGGLQELTGGPRVAADHRHGRRPPAARLA